MDRLDRHSFPASRALSRSGLRPNRGGVPAARACIKPSRLDAALSAGQAEARNVVLWIRHDHSLAGRCCAGLAQRRGAGDEVIKASMRDRDDRARELGADLEGHLELEVNGHVLHSQPSPHQGSVTARRSHANDNSRVVAL